MQVQKITSAERGYAPADAVLAIRLVAKQRGVSIDTLAKTLKLAKTSFENKLYHIRTTVDGSEYARNQLQVHAERISRKERLDDQEIERLATKALGFGSVPEMIAYAKEQCPLPDGVAWTPPPAAPEMPAEASLDKLPLYRQAITLLIGETGKFSGQWINKLQGINPRSAEKFLDDAPSTLKDANKLELVRQFALLLSQELQITPPWTPDEMLRAAQARFPEAMPATEPPPAKPGGRSV